MRQKTAPWLVLAVAAAAAAAWVVASPAAARSAAAEKPAETKLTPAAKPAPERKQEILIEARPPPFSDGIFPCMDCHQDQKDRERRELGFHDEQQAIFSHDAEHRWCLDCHDYENRDMLRLASGALVPFTESYRLCGQCHGDKARDWRAGIHGKRAGQWDGAKTYLLCASCHDPHAPSFKGVKEIVVGGEPTVAPTQEYLKPDPRPTRPEEMKRR
jgi:hypothetical protein